MVLEYLHIHLNLKLQASKSNYLQLLHFFHVILQVMVSASRQEMVGHLLKDIVESSEKPSLSSQDPAYDQFGFRQEELNNPETLEEKAEKLRRMTQVAVILTN